MKHILFLFGVLALGTAAHAQAKTEYVASFLTGEQLHDKCKDSEQEKGDTGVITKVAFCNGYVQAHFEALSYEGVVSPGGSLSGNQLVAVVNKFLSAHPDQWSLPAGGLVRFALVGAFPAPKKN
jgi:hypothetical protein